MDTAIISAFSALAGSIVGGLTSGITTWVASRSQARAGHHLHNVSQREALYRDFVVAASQTYGSAVTASEPGIQDLVVLYGMISRMRIVSTPRVVASAEKAADSIIETYFVPKKNVLGIRNFMKNGEMIDPLREFSEIARDELARLTRAPVILR